MIGPALMCKNNNLRIAKTKLPQMGVFVSLSRNRPWGSSSLVWQKEAALSTTWPILNTILFLNEFIHTTLLAAMNVISYRASLHTLSLTISASLSFIAGFIFLVAS